MASEAELMSRDVRLVAPRVVVVSAALAVAGSVLYVALNAGAPREAFLNPIGVVGGVLATLGAAGLSLSVFGWRLVRPRWPALVTAAALWFTGASAWFLAVGMPATASRMTNEAFDALLLDNEWMILQAVPKMALGLVGLVALAVAGLRSGTISRPAGAIMLLAALLSVWPAYPPGLIVTAIALALVARGGRATAAGGQR